MIRRLYGAAGAAAWGRRGAASAGVLLSLGSPWAARRSPWPAVVGGFRVSDQPASWPADCQCKAACGALLASPSPPHLCRTYRGSSRARASGRPGPAWGAALGLRKGEGQNPRAQAAALPTLPPLPRLALSLTLSPSCLPPCSLSLSLLSPVSFCAQVTLHGILFWGGLRHLFQYVLGLGQLCRGCEGHGPWLLVTGLMKGFKLSW